MSCKFILQKDSINVFIVLFHSKLKFNVMKGSKHRVMTKGSVKMNKKQNNNRDKYTKSVAISWIHIFFVRLLTRCLDTNLKWYNWKHHNCHLIINTQTILMFDVHHIDCTKWLKFNCSTCKRTIFFFSNDQIKISSKLFVFFLLFYFVQAKCWKLYYFKLQTKSNFTLNFFFFILLCIQVSSI